jgi:ABC-type branched-subunit amino acid transport system ATPase component
MSALLEIRDLSVRYGGLKAVDHVSLAVEPGSFVGLIGPNGAGKTTLIDAVCGLTPATGSLLLDGHEIGGLPPHRRARLGVGRTFQSLELFEELSVRENMLVVAERPRWWSVLADLVRVRPQRAAIEAVDWALDLLGLVEMADALPQELSLGQRKLVTVGRALSAKPRLLLLDEPGAGLDTQESEPLRKKLIEVTATGTSILLVDHDMGLVLGACEYINVIEFGRLIAGGTPAEVRTDERVIHAYLGAEDSPDEAEQSAEPAAVEIER